MKYRFNIKNLDCASCAKVLEDKLNKDKNITSAKVNFATSKVIVTTNIENPFNYVKKIIKEEEPEAILSEEKINEENNNSLLRLTVGGLIGLIAILIPLSQTLKTILLVISYLILLSKTFVVAIKQLIKKNINENLLVTISCIGAFILGETKEGLMVIFLYELGKLLEAKAVSKSRKSVEELMDIKEETANIKTKNKISTVPVESVKLGDIIVVKEGEKIPLDGIIMSGKGFIDTSALTGEADPIYVKKDDKVLSGTINKDNPLEIKVTSLFKDSTVNKILELVETATERKAKTETVVSKYSSYYTIIIILIALLVGIFLPLLTSCPYSESIYKGLTILVISCPCSIAISIPLSYFGGIGRASKEGILIKGSNYLDNIRNIKEIIFDKTGTITTGEFYVSKINIYDKKYSEEKVMELYAKGEVLSNHPIAKSIVKKYHKEVSTEDIKDYQEISGKGISYKYNNKEIKIGNSKFCNINKEDQDIYLTINNKLVSSLTIEDEIKDSAKKTVTSLERMNIKVHMFTGDSKEKATLVADSVGIKNINYQMLPQDKYNKLEELIKNKKENTIVSFVGDGINDAPVLTRSDLGISMGAVGTDAAIEASDVVIMNDSLEKILDAIKISQKTNKIIKENLCFAIFVKLLVLILSLLSISSMWQAVFADVGVTIICISNTLRILK